MTSLGRASRICSRRMRETACSTDAAFGVVVQSRLHSSNYPPLNFMITPCPLFRPWSAALASGNLDLPPNAHVRCSEITVRDPCQCLQGRTPHTGAALSHGWSCEGVCKANVVWPSGHKIKTSCDFVAFDTCILTNDRSILALKRVAMWAYAWSICAGAEGLIEAAFQHAFF